MTIYYYYHNINVSNMLENVSSMHVSFLLKHMFILHVHRFFCNPFDRLVRADAFAYILYAI